MSLNTILATAPLATTGFHIKATGTTLGNSLIWDNGTNVGSGNQGTTYTLDVSGSLRSTTSAYFATTSGSVGIGISNPTSKLHLYDGVNPLSLKIQRTSVPVYLSDVQPAATTGASSWSHNVENTSNGSATWGSFGNSVYTGSAIMLNADTSTSYITFLTASAANTVPTEKMRITGTGYLGLGYTNPTQKVHIQDESSYTAVLISNNYGAVSGTGGTSAIQFGLRDGAFSTYDASRIQARSTGNPNSALDFKVYGSSLNTVMTLLGIGRVGIGITNPAVSLDVGSKTDAILLPSGTTAQRPSAVAGFIRHNTSLQSLDYYNGTNWFSLVPDGSTAANAVTNLTQFDAMGKPAGVYWFSPPGYSLGAIQLYYDSGLQSLGVGWVQVFSSPLGGSATVNEINKNLPLTQVLFRTSDGVTWATAGWDNGVYRRFINRNASDGSSDLSTTGTKTGFRIYFGFAGGHGIYNTTQEVCSWANSTGSIGAGFDGTCGSFPNNLRWGTGNSDPYYTTINKTWQTWIRW
jgi:hypothetical protein